MFKQIRSCDLHTLKELQEVLGFFFVTRYFRVHLAFKKL